MRFVRQYLMQVVVNFGTSVWRWMSMFGVEGVYYDMGFFGVEVLEICFQTYQAYKLSGLVSRVWINRLYAIALMLNCWSTVLVHITFRHNQLVKRIVLLSVDTLFDSITNIGIPVVVIYPYYHQFELPRHDFPLVNYYDDVWWIQAISENQQVFVTSWLDFISKLSPHFFILASVLVLKQYLVGKRDNTLFSKQETHAPLRIDPSPSIIVQSTPRFHRIHLSWTDWLHLFYGVGILVIHVHATTIAVNANVKECLLDALAMRLNPHGVKSLVVSSCAHFHVPPFLQTLSSMQMMKIYNTTIERWDVEAELHQAFHPDLQMLYVCESNFTSGVLPVGLLGAHFPSRLVDIEFSGTNLVDLPSDLHTKWLFVQYFILEGSPGITEIPHSLVVMKILQLILRSNSITSIPDELLAEQAFWALRLDGNPLVELPKDIETIERSGSYVHPRGVVAALDAH